MTTREAAMTQEERKAAARRDPWQWLHDSGFSWDDVNAIASILADVDMDIEATQPSPDGLLREALDLAIDAFDPMAPDWPNFEKSIRGLNALKDARAALAASPSGDRPQSEPSEPGSLRAICVVCGLRGRVRSTGGTVLVGGHDAPAGHEFTPATDYAALSTEGGVTR